MDPGPWTLDPGPWTTMLLAAFKTRSWTAPHSTHVQDLTSRNFFPKSTPHTEHNRRNGNQRRTRHHRWQPNTFGCNSLSMLTILGHEPTCPARNRPNRKQTSPAHRSLEPPLWPLRPPNRQSTSSGTRTARTHTPAPKPLTQPHRTTTVALWSWRGWQPRAAPARRRSSHQPHTRT